jgi:REP element-mobilizing transposase RayT
MPRFARLHCPFALVHVIARFVNRSYRLAGPLERAAFLERIPAALARCDWTLCAYALMSNHIHLAMWAGHAPVWRFLKPLHIAFARFVNGAHRMTGPVFSERATTIVMPTERLAALVAYLHNNPVRAGVVSRAAESSWTSHRAWIGLEPAPSWLAVEPALQQAGFDGSEQGRRAFDEYVTQRCADARDPTCSPAQLRQARRQLRRHCGLPIEVSSPLLGADERMRFELGMRAAAGCPGRWDGDLHELLRRISDKTGVMERARQMAEARRGEGEGGEQ